MKKIFFPSKIGFKKTDEGLLFYEGSMLNNLKINQKSIKVSFPRFKAFVLNMCYLPRDELSAIREKYVNISFNRATRQREESVDTDKFMNEYIQKAVVGWSGLTFDIVKSLVPIEVDEKELNNDVPYTHEDAMWLVKNSTEFDSFISDTMSQVDLFSVTNKAEQQKK